MVTKLSYNKKFLDPRWQKFRLQVFERDEFSCRHCGGESVTLHAHHTYYEEFGTDPWDYDLYTVITLCDDCHKKEHALLPFANKLVINTINQTGISCAEKGALATWFEVIQNNPSLPIDFWSVMTFIFHDEDFYNQAKEVFYNTADPVKLSIKAKIMEYHEMIYNYKSDE